MSDLVKKEKNEVSQESYYEQLFDVDIIENKDSYLLIGEVPGAEKEDLDIKVENEILTIKATSNLQKANKKVLFARSFQIGNDVDVNKISATLEDGLLKLVLAKPEQMKPIQIKIA